MGKSNDYIRFDWAIKRILRDKANAGVLEGLMTVLIGQPITITEILESESNRAYADDKSNRVDVKAKTADGKIIIVEVQLGRESHFMQRILFGTAKAIVEQLQIGQDYENIHKVYSINVLYFDLGAGEDYVYHGTTVFTGMTHPDSVLQFNSRESDIVSAGASVTSPREAFPEYFLLRVNQFNEVARTPIEEWMAYLKDGIIRDDTQTPGLQEAKEKLDYMRMTREERRAYEDFMIRVHQQNDIWETAKRDGWREGHNEGLIAGRAEGLSKGRAEGLSKGRAEGLSEGRAEGLAEGVQQANFENARKMKGLGLDTDVIAQVTSLTAEQIAAL